MTLLPATSVGNAAMRFAGTGWRSSGAQMERDLAAVARDFWRAFGQVAARLPFAEDLLTAYYCAFDRETPNHVRAALLAALAYFVAPVDAVPDILPVIGFTDDAAVIAGAIRLVWSHLTPVHRSAARAALNRAAAER
jgi:uncharacterized membrane protein YkvA (DUF1232 family)